MFTKKDKKINLINEAARFLLKYSVFFFVLSCTGVSTLNMKYHDFGTRPKTIIWFQVAGFSEEHLALLRYSMPDSTNRTSLEQISCVGKLWNYNLYDLRPVPHLGFLSQMMGTPNIKNSCEDFSKKPVWEYLKASGYQTGIFEVGSSSDSSLQKVWDCKDSGAKFREGITLWRMEKASKKNAPSFHYQDQGTLGEGGVFYDRSCQGKICYASMFNNVRSIYTRFKVKHRRALFIIRDFSYFNALTKKNISGASEILLELSRAFSYFLQEMNRGGDLLLVITSSGTQNFEFPSEGMQWAKYEQKGGNVIFRRRGLISSALAAGAMSENFCGIYEEQDVMKRMLWVPKQRLKILK